MHIMNTSDVINFLQNNKLSGKEINQIREELAKQKAVLDISIRSAKDVENTIYEFIDAKQQGIKLTPAQIEKVIENIDFNDPKFSWPDGEFDVYEDAVEDAGIYIKLKNIKWKNYKRYGSDKFEKLVPGDKIIVPNKGKYEEQVVLERKNRWEVLTDKYRVAVANRIYYEEKPSKELPSEIDVPVCHLFYGDIYDYLEREERFLVTSFDIDEENRA